MTVTGVFRLKTPRPLPAGAAERFKSRQRDDHQEPHPAAQVIVGKIRQLIGADVTVGEQPCVLFEAAAQLTLDRIPMAVSCQCH